MRVLVSTIAVTLGMVLGASPAAAKDEQAVALEPSSKWHLDYAEGYCRLARIFGEGKQRSLVYFEQYAPSNSFAVTVAGKPFGKVARKDEVFFRFGPSFPEQERGYTKGTFTGFGTALLMGHLTLNPPASEEEVEEPRELGLPKPVAIKIPEGRSVDTVTIRSGKHSVALALGDLAKPMEALNDCSRNLIASWGIDWEAHESLTRTATLSNGMELARVFSRDYPQELVRNGVVGLVTFRAMVEPSGAVESCEIQTSTRPREFDDLVCKHIMKVGKFEAALDSKGEPIRSFVTSTVRFTIG